MYTVRKDVRQIYLKVGSEIRNMMLENSANLQAADSPRWTNLIRDAKSVTTPTVM